MFLVEIQFVNYQLCWIDKNIRKFHHVHVSKTATQFTNNNNFYSNISLSGYLQSQQMDTVSLDFCKLSPHLREEYSILKRGLKIKHASKPRTLVDIIKEFIEIEDTGMHNFEHLSKWEKNVILECITFFFFFFIMWNECLKCCELHYMLTFSSIQSVLSILVA